ncbi:hypothetical protein [Pseudomonas sp. TH15]|uniref:hypothetical protein n=1 Tax=Pseudomonas sp. TH15 TaxID=2796381 RepID=UPI0019149E0E|nr:hypothetical protein [Pseudomonas sp. TH15]MBK5512620.1 hypothetical protein [Pseudomonas sp. TH15]
MQPIVEVEANSNKRLKNGALVELWNKKHIKNKQPFTVGARLAREGVSPVKHMVD